jgi:tetratricopeptide (TPR) repeat protein/class 3 adenylate cyclase
LKRRIAAVLMVDVAGGNDTASADAHDIASADPPTLELAQRRHAAAEAVRSVVTIAGGRVLNVGMSSPRSVGEFQSAVAAVRAAVDVQATLRARNKSLAAEDRLPFRISVGIGEVVDGDDAVPEETMAAAERLIDLATPSSVCISRSVRDAVVSKLKLHQLDLTIEGQRPEPVSQQSPVPAQKPGGKPAAGSASGAIARNVVALLALVCSLAAIGLWVSERPVPGLTPSIPAESAAPAGVPTHREADAKPKDVKPKEKPQGGTLEYMPAYAPDPAAVLTAKRMLPQAWRECHGTSADKAVAACKLLLDSGIAKGAELADIQLWNGKALRERHELDKAITAFTASLAAKPTAEAFSQRGNVHYDKAAWDKAVADYSEAIRLEPQNGEALNNRAWTYYRAGDAAKALVDANKAVELLSAKAYVWDTRGHIHARLGNRDAAIGDFRQALAIDPANRASKDGLSSLGAN